MEKQDHSEGTGYAVQKNYEEQASKEYNLNKVFNDIFSKGSKTIDLILLFYLSKIMKWHSMLLFGS